MILAAFEKVLNLPPPAWVRKVEVAAILGVFAKAFDVDPPALEDRPVDECLPVFREFTAACMEAALVDEQVAAMYRTRLREGGFRIGSQLRSTLNVRASSSFAFAQFLYRGIGIELAADESGDLRFGPCFFSERYTPEDCWFMSAFDEGFLCGIMGTDSLARGKDCDMAKAIVVGSGAGGCMAAKELAACGFDVTVLEAGHAFKPFSWDMSKLEPARRAGVFFDERMISLLFPEMRIAKAQDGLVHVAGRAVGGTTTLATGNALRYDRYLAELGINLDAEFAELEREVPQTTDHRAGWSDLTERLFSVFEDLGLNPQVAPKFMEDASRCVVCGECVLGCKYGAKWTADKLIEGVEGVHVVEGATVKGVMIEDGKAIGVVLRKGGRIKLAQADLVVLSAGGLGTPVILDASGIPASPTLFVDPVLCVAARWEGARLERQLPMPFISEQPDYILSPYFDWLSFYFNKSWRMPHGDIMSLMVKMADSSNGSYDGRHLDKPLIDSDWEIIARAVDQCYDILEAVGVPREKAFFGTVNAGHPGGCFPLTEAEVDTLHHDVLPDNLYVADSSLFPRSMGNPPILTIMALAKRVARLAAQAVG